MCTFTKTQAKKRIVLQIVSQSVIIRGSLSPIVILLHINILRGWRSASTVISPPVWGGAATSLRNGRAAAPSPLTVPVTPVPINISVLVAIVASARGRASRTIAVTVTRRAVRR